METVQIRTTHNVGIDVEIAGLGDRALATLVDTLVQGAYLVVLGIAAIAAESLALAIIGALPALLYHLVCEVFFDGQSLGKRLRDIHVVRLDGGQPALGDFLIRWLLRAVDIHLTYYVAGVVTILVTGRGQRLGDLAAGTCVARVHPRTSLAETGWRAHDDAYEPVFPQAEFLSREEIAVARDVLQALVTGSRTRENEELGRTTKDLLARRMAVQSDLRPVDFLRTVVHDYQHLQGSV